jgi:hypothetical protein
MNKKLLTVLSLVWILALVSFVSAGTIVPQSISTEMVECNPGYWDWSCRPLQNAIDGNVQTYFYPAAMNIDVKMTFNQLVTGNYTVSYAWRGDNNNVDCKGRILVSQDGVSYNELFSGMSSANLRSFTSSVPFRYMKVLVGQNAGDDYCGWVYLNEIKVEQNNVPNPTPDPTCLERYDLNNDGKVNSKDYDEVVSCRQSIDGGNVNDSCKLKADVNKDGVVNVFDITALQHASCYKNETTKHTSNNNGIKDLSFGSCDESWQCTGWSECTNGGQTRQCSDLSVCETFDLKPIEARGCEMPQVLTSDLVKTVSPYFLPLVIFTVLLLLVLIVVVLRTR